MDTEILKPFMLDDTGQNIVTALNSLVAIVPSIKGEKGDKGDTGAQGIKGEKGDKGDTPIKGTDYWTADDISSIENDVHTLLKSDVDSVQSEILTTKQELETKITSVQTTLDTNGVTSSEKELILTLFESIAYNNADMKATFESLKQAWTTEVNK